jgi:hypothetical protein
MEYRNEIKHTLERMLFDTLQIDRERDRGRENDGEVVLSSYKLLIITIRYDRTGR